MLDYTLTTWRLISQPRPATGAWNMAVDEAILEAVGMEAAPATLRFYAWSPPCLSLGYAQPASDVDRSVLAARGWEMVRRPTGGRAILHTDELTYSVVGPHSEPRLMGSVIESYRVLAQALLYSLHLVGISAQAKEKPATLAVAAPMGAPVDPKQNPVCFETPSSYEITAGGKKLFGSAQARRKEGVLQHGSLPLYGDLTRITEALVFPTPAARQEAAQRLLGRAVTAEQPLGAPLAWETAAQALKQAFEEKLNLRLLPAELTPAEAKRAEQLMAEKYANPEWVGRI